MRTSTRRTRAARITWMTAGVMLGCSMALAAPPLVAQVVEYSGGIQAATGRYLFTERTTSFAWSNTLSLTAGRVQLSATLPLIWQNSTAVTYVGGTPIPTGGPDAGAVNHRNPGQRVPMGPTSGGRGTRSGSSAAMIAAAGSTTDQYVAEPGPYSMNVGDPLLQAGVELYRGFGVVRTLGAHAFAKAPVASVESGIGTGQWDYGGGATLGLGVGNWFGLTDASYWVLGDLPELPLRNMLAYGVSIGRTVGAGRWSVLGSVMGGTPIIAQTDGSLSVGLGVGYVPNTTAGFNAGISVGLTESTPDLSTYIGWRIALGGRTPQAVARSR